VSRVLDWALQVLDLRGPMTTSELAQELEISRNKVYQRLSVVEDTLVCKELNDRGGKATWRTI